MFANSRGPHKSIVLFERMQLVHGCEVGAHLPVCVHPGFIAVIKECSISLQAIARYCKSPTSVSPSVYANSPLLLGSLTNIGSNNFQPCLHSLTTHVSSL